MYKNFDKTLGYISNTTKVQPEGDFKTVLGLNIPTNFLTRSDGYEMFLEVVAPIEKISVKFENDTLTVSYDKPPVTSSKESEEHLSEIKFGSFVKQFEFTREIDENKILCEFSDNILHLFVPFKKLLIPIIPVDKLTIISETKVDSVEVLDFTKTLIESEIFNRPVTN
jgi:HSP20 family molecular chaperone IbpA